MEPETRGVFLDSKTCPHVRVVPEVFDQTLGVACDDCNLALGYCWMDNHCSEAWWNKAVAYVKSLPAASPDEDRDDWHDAIPCEQSRADVCFLCGGSMTVHDVNAVDEAAEEDASVE